MTMKFYEQAKVKLRYYTDPSEPVLLVRVLEGAGRYLQSVEVISEHPVWRGAKLGKDHFSLVEVVEN